MKKLLKVLPVVFMVCLIFTSIFAIGKPEAIAGTADAGIQAKASNIWATIASIIQILAVAAVVFAGLRYMFASADQKADIKKSMGILVIGAILIFGATFVLQLIYNATNSTLK